jgi:hypothetical protein
MLYRGNVECSVETCSSVIICEIIVQLLVIVQNKKNTFHYFILCVNFCGVFEKTAVSPHDTLTKLSLLSCGVSHHFGG